MNDKKLQSLVAEAVALDRDIANATERLKQIKAHLINEALLREGEQQVTEGGGKAITFEGADGCIARVNLPSPSLKPKIDGEGKTIEKVRKLAGAAFEALFRPVIAYKLKDYFRAEAERLIPKQAASLITLCTVESQPRVSFETKETIEQ